MAAGAMAGAASGAATGTTAAAAAGGGLFSGVGAALGGPVGIAFLGVSLVSSFFSSKSKKRAKRRVGQANAIRDKQNRIKNAGSRTLAAKSFKAAQAEGKVASQSAGGSLRGSATQGAISGGRAAFEGALSDSMLQERMGIRANLYNRQAANAMSEAGNIVNWNAGIQSFSGIASDWWASRG